VFSRLLLAALLPLTPALAQSDVFYSVPPADAPELAARGTYTVGVRTLRLTHPEQPDILHFDKATGKAAVYDRPLTVEVWYPATLAPSQMERTVYSMSFPGASGKTFDVIGKASRDAAPLTGKAFPVVVVSHGYPGSRFFLSYLTENLASKGYVVAAIDHTDSVLGAIAPFPSTLLNREKDQLFTLDTIARLSQSADSFLNGIADTTHAAIVGYSMGGYGALASAGAPYSTTGVGSKAVPGGYFNELTAPIPHANSFQAMVAISPWGNQPPHHSWSAAGLAAIHIPSLFIAGDQDDVSDFEHGILPAFNHSIHSDRCLLVYENARHNVGGNPPPAEALGTFTTREFFDEPVWRKDRITAINQHFITAFLDLTLKGDESRRAYLHPATVRSNDAKWGDNYWKGFQRRWALGLQMRCLAAAAN
jgi:predicted dienelactone hydrolase